jgi:hypothetical protein
MIGASCVMDNISAKSTAEISDPITFLTYCRQRISGSRGLQTTDVYRLEVFSPPGKNVVCSRSNRRDNGFPGFSISTSLRVVLRCPISYLPDYGMQGKLLLLALLDLVAFGAPPQCNRDVFTNSVL